METLKQEYNDLAVANLVVFTDLITHASEQNAEETIKEIFVQHGKGDCFLLIENQNITRTFHSVSVYLLGRLLLEKGFFENTKCFKVNDISDFEFSTSFPGSSGASPLNNKDSKKMVADYIWAFTSLYHDVMTYRENSKITKLINTAENPFITPASFLNFMEIFGKNKIRYTIFDDYQEVNEITKNATLFECNNNVTEGVVPSPTYSEEIINSYFRKRLHDGCIDHGIASGFIFYDSLVKNYLEKKSKYSPGKPSVTFEDNELTYRPEHILLFKYIADAIITHNVWRYDEDSKPEYAKYGLLDKRLKSRENRFSISENPLLFFLCLVDTIEPTKFFYQSKNENILEGIEIKINGKEIKLKCNLPVNQQTKNGWFYKLKSMEDWLELKVEQKTDDKIVISIL